LSLLVAQSRAAENVGVGNRQVVADRVVGEGQVTGTVGVGNRQYFTDLECKGKISVEISLYSPSNVVDYYFVDQSTCDAQKRSPTDTFTSYPALSGSGIGAYSAKITSSPGGSGVYCYLIDTAASSLTITVTTQCSSGSSSGGGSTVVIVIVVLVVVAAAAGAGYWWYRRKHAAAVTSTTDNLYTPLTDTSAPRSDGASAHLQPA